MPDKPEVPNQFLLELEGLRARLENAEEALRAIRSNEVDALMVLGKSGEQLYTLKGADHSYRMLIEDMHEGALTLSAEGVILYANRHFAQMLKTPLEKVIGSTIYTWVMPESERILKPLLGKNGGGKRREQFVLINGDQSVVPVFISVSNLVRNELSEFFCLVVTDLTEQKRSDAIAASEKLTKELLAASNQSRLALLSMIEDQKLAEESLRQSEEKFRNYIERAPDGVFMVDNTGRYIDVNAAACRILGFSREEILSMSIRDLSAEESFEDGIAHFNKLMETGAATSDIWHNHKDGTKRCLTVNAVKLSETKVLGFAKDITIRKLIEEELRESKVLFEAVVENVPHMIFLKEAIDLRFVIFNRAGEELLGYDRKTLLGKNNLDLFPPEQAANFMAKDREVLDGKAGFLDIPEEPYRHGKKRAAIASYAKDLHPWSRWDHKIPVGHFRGHYRPQTGRVGACQGA